MTVCVIIVKLNESSLGPVYLVRFSGPSFRQAEGGKKRRREQKRVKRLAAEGGGRAAVARVTVMETRGWSVQIKAAAVRSGPAARDSCLPGRWEPLSRS